MNLWAFCGLIVAAVYASGLVALVYCALRAPEGYEDRHGFHFGAKSRDDH
jgi:hypothetical protein